MYRLFFITTFLLTTTVRGQFLKRPDDVKSPTAASIGRYGDIPVSYSNGTVDVSVPLYQMRSFGTPLDISLRYDSSGLRINAPAGPQGVSWSLSCLGVITRSIQGKADEQISLPPGFVAESDGTAIKLGFFYRYSYLTKYWGNYSNFIIAYLFPSDWPDILYDTQPDIFSFNVMGHTGKFFMGQDGVWRVQSDSNMEVLIEESDFRVPLNFSAGDYGASPRKSFGKIVLKDDQGTIYTFGSSVNSIEYTCLDFYSQSAANTYPSAWYLNSVVDRHGKTLYSFEYERGKPIAFLDSSRRVKGIMAGGGGYAGSLTCTYDDTGPRYRGMGSLISPVYLTDIVSADEKLHFNYSAANSLKYKDEPDLITTFQTGNGSEDFVAGSLYWSPRFTLLTSNFKQQDPSLNSQNLLSWNSINEMLEWRKLDSIIIEKNYGTSIRKVEFQYSESPYTRLFLLQAVVSGRNPETGSYDNSLRYQFNYKNRECVDYVKYLHKGVDHWGYYNRNEDYTGDFYLSYFPYRETTDNFKTCGTLQAITYPTGGTSEFEFEPNDFSQYQDYLSESLIGLKPAGASKRLTGGLRIKSIKNKSGNGISEKTSYRYTTDIDSDVSSGILEFMPRYYSVDYPGGVDENGDPSVMLGHESTNSIVPLTNFFGSHILYNKVFEIKTNVSGTFYNEFCYTDHNDYPDKNGVQTWLFSRSIADDHTSFAFKRAKLKYKRTYNSQNTLQRYEQFIYRNDPALSERKVRSVMTNRLACDNFSEESILAGFDQVFVATGNAYEIYYGDFDLSTQIIQEYFGNLTLTRTINFESEDYPLKKDALLVHAGSRRKKSENQDSSTGELIETRWEYLNNCLSAQNCANGPYGLVSSIKKYRNNTLLATENMSYVPLTTPTSLVLESVQDLKSVETDGPKIEFTKYDPASNVIEYRMKDDTYTSFVYDGTNKDILAKIENARYVDLTPWLNSIRKTYSSNASEAQAYVADPVGYFNNRSVEIRAEFDQMRNQLPNAMITSYTYDFRHRLKSISNPNGKTEFYEYDSLDRLTKVLDENGNVIKAIEYNIKND